LSENNATAEDRWMDVVWLDDAIDRMQDEPVVGRLLVRFKSKCAAEAKTLQKREALQMMKSQFGFVKRPSKSHKRQK